MATSTANDKEYKSLVGCVTDPKTDAEVREKIISARIALLLKAPFFGNLATRLEVINADKWCGTAATDGRKLYYNSEFLKTMPAKQLEFLIGHEVLHCVYDHMGRCGDRDRRLWNIADDYCVNQDLVDQNIGEKIPVGLYDTKYKGMSAEEVYDDLYKQADKIDVDNLLDQLIDEHLDGEENGEGDSGEGKDGNGDGKGKSSAKPKISAAERKEIRDEMKEAMLSAAQSSGVGNLPKGVQRLIGEFTAPQLNWNELIQQEIKSVLKSDYTFARASRKGWHMDAILPGSNFDDDIDIAICTDASGSMTDEMNQQIYSEIKGIMESFGNFRLHLWTFDTECYNAQVFTPENIDEIMDYKVAGGGGTDFMCNWEFMKANDILPKKLIMFTDGYAWDSWGDPNYCDTLFVIHGSKDIEAPFGMTTYYEFEKDKVRA